MVNPAQHKPTEANKKRVSELYSVGIVQEDIARLLGIDPKTLRLHYREELDSALLFANEAVGRTLHSKALSGDTSAIIWWEKTRAGKRDTLDHTSSDKSMSPKQELDLSKLTDDELAILQKAMTR